MVLLLQGRFEHRAILLSLKVSGFERQVRTSSYHEVFEGGGFSNRWLKALLPDEYISRYRPTVVNVVISLHQFY